MKKIAYAPANALTSVISSHEYTYQPGGNITTWKRNNGLTDTITTYGYDAADQLLSALTAATATPSVTTETFGYSYDKAGNRQSEQRDTVMAGFTFNNLNQVLSRNGGGGILVQGNTDEPAQVTVNGKSVTPAADNTFETVVPGTNGANAIAVTAKDFSPSQNTQTKSWSAMMSAGATATYTYDGNGNMTGDGSRTFQWDAKNRLTRIVYTGTNASTEMTYDGLDRRVSIVEKDGTGTVVSSKAFVWDGLSIADQRIGSTVSKQYFSEGWRDASAGTNYFYGRDHLGSVREVVNASSSVLARYGYDAYGCVTKLSGTIESDFQYTGHYAHSRSGIYFAPFRGYSPGEGRWISRDPIQELGGINLYGAVFNNPVNWVDLLGLDVWHLNKSTSVPGPGGPYGHSGAIVGQPGGDNFTYHSYGPDGLTEKSFNSLADAMNYAADQGYDRYSQHQSCEKGDQAARDQAKEWADDSYNAASHNCQDMVNSMMDAAGVPWVSRSWPNRTFNENAPYGKSRGAPSDFRK